MTNIIWIVLITLLGYHANLTVLRTNPLGFAFLVIYGVIFCVQFLCLIWHRLITIIRSLAQRGRSSRPTDVEVPENDEERGNRPEMLVSSDDSADRQGVKAICDRSSSNSGVNRKEIRDLNVASEKTPLLHDGDRNATRNGKPSTWHLEEYQTSPRKPVLCAEASDVWMSIRRLWYL